MGGCGLLLRKLDKLVGQNVARVYQPDRTKRRSDAWAGPTYHKLAFQLEHLLLQPACFSLQLHPSLAAHRLQDRFVWDLQPATPTGAEFEKCGRKLPGTYFRQVALCYLVIGHYYDNGIL